MAAPPTGHTLRELFEFEIVASVHDVARGIHVVKLEEDFDVDLAEQILEGLKEIIVLDSDDLA